MRIHLLHHWRSAQRPAQIWTPGEYDSADLPDGLAEHWLKNGHAEAVTMAEPEVIPQAAPAEDVPPVSEGDEPPAEEAVAEPDGAETPESAESDVPVEDDDASAPESGPDTTAADETPAGDDSPRPARRSPRK